MSTTDSILNDQTTDSESNACETSVDTGDKTVSANQTYVCENNVISQPSMATIPSASHTGSSEVTESNEASAIRNASAVDRLSPELHMAVLPSTATASSTGSELSVPVNTPVEMTVVESFTAAGPSEHEAVHASIDTASSPEIAVHATSGSPSSCKTAVHVESGGASSRETCDLAPSIYHVKWVKFCGSTTAIVMQNQNGPCPLLAIANILLLQAKIRLIAGTELVAADQLIGYIADFIFDNVPKHITDDTRLNYEQNMHDAIAVFPRLQTGLDVNVRFTGVHDFEYTPECIVFDLLDIPLVHGWLVDPEMTRVVEALGSCSYNQIVEKIIENKNSDKEELVTSALIAEEFLNSTASQLTYHGLCELSAMLQDEQLCVLFRNNHFSTLYKRKGELFALATDQGFLNEANVVWETQSNVEGDGHFVDANFHTYRLPEMNADIGKKTAAVQSIVSPPVNSKEQIDHDYLVALSLEQDQGQVVGTDVWMDTDIATLSDHDLAVRLQREEELKAGAAVNTAPGPSSGSGVSLHRQQKAASSSASTSAGSSAEVGGAGGGKDKKSENCIIL